MAHRSTTTEARVSSNNFDHAPDTTHRPRMLRLVPALPLQSGFCLSHPPHTSLAHRAIRTATPSSHRITARLYDCPDLGQPCRFPPLEGAMDCAVITRWRGSLFHWQPERTMIALSIRRASLRLRPVFFGGDDWLYLLPLPSGTSAYSIQMTFCASPPSVLFAQVNRSIKHPPVF